MLYVHMTEPKEFEKARIWGHQKQRIHDACFKKWKIESSQKMSHGVRIVPKVGRTMSCFLNRSTLFVFSSGFWNVIVLGGQVSRAELESRAI